MMRGLPASGKSTLAKEMCAEMNTVRVNRDLLREMVHFGEWLPQREEGIVQIEKGIAAYYLVEERKNVVIDDTNLTEGHEALWRDWANTLQHKGLTDLEFQVIDVKTDVYTCIERDLVREKSVGSHVIWGMALENGLVDPEIRYILCDIDGTLAEIEHRRHYVKEKCERCGGDGRDGKQCPNEDVGVRHERKDWQNFYAEMDGDSLREEVYADVEATLAASREQGHKTYLILFSARPANYRKQTESWLERMGVDDYTTLIMRRAGDSREDSLVKRELLHKYFKDKSKIIKVFDDRPRVVRMWRDEGLAVVDVGDGIEF